MASSLFCLPSHPIWQRVKSAEAVLSECADKSLTRCLGPLELVMLGVGAIVGSGVFVLVGVAASMAGPALSLSCVLTGVICLLTAICYAENAARLPVAGSSYVYVYTVLGELPAWITAWNIILSYTLGTSAVARGLAGYIASACAAVGMDLPAWVWKMDMGSGITLCPIAIVLVGMVTCICLAGMKESATFNTIVASTKVATLLVVIITASMFADTKNWENFAPFGMPGVFKASAAFFFAYLGFDAVAACAEEAKQPEKDLPIGIVGSLLVAMVLYIGIGASLTLMVPFDSLDKDAPISSAFRDKNMPWTQFFVSLGAMTGMTTSMTVSIISQSRLMLALGRDGLLPVILSAVNPKTGIPTWSTIITGTMACTFAVIADMDMLVQLVTISVLFAFVMVCSTIVIIHHPGNKIVSRSLWVLQISWVVGCSLIKAVAENDGTLQPPITKAMGVVAAVCMLLSAVNLGRILTQAPGEVTKAAFTAPFFPYVPLFGVLSNIFMMVNLGGMAWLQLAVWVVLGFLFYICYCMKNSNLTSELNESTGLLNSSPAMAATETVPT